MSQSVTVIPVHAKDAKYKLYFFYDNMVTRTINGAL